MKQSTLNTFFKNPASSPGNAVLSTHQSSDNATSQTGVPVQRGTKRKASGSADPRREYEKTKRLRLFQYKWLDQPQYSWLKYDKDGGVMYCFVCREFKHLLKGTPVAIVAGDFLFRKRTLDDHLCSKQHQNCMDAHKAKLSPGERPLAVIQRKMSSQSHEKFNMLFISAYLVAMRNWSFRDFDPVCQLLDKLGLHPGENYRNTHGIHSFVESIAYIQRLETVKDIEQCRFFSLRADGSTDRSTSEHESVYIRFVHNGEAVNKFVGLEEVESSTSERSLAAIDSTLANYAGISLATQKDKLINVNLDGAPVNMGIYNGVGALLQQRIGEYVSVSHCINHNLELAILDLRKDESYLAIFEKTLKVKQISDVID